MGTTSRCISSCHRTKRSCHRPSAVSRSFQLLLDRRGQFRRRGEPRVPLVQPSFEPREEQLRRRGRRGRIRQWSPVGLVTVQVHERAVECRGHAVECGRPFFGRQRGHEASPRFGKARGSSVARHRCEESFRGTFSLRRDRGIAIHRNPRLGDDSASGGGREWGRSGESARSCGDGTRDGRTWGATPCTSRARRFASASSRWKTLCGQSGRCTSRRPTWRFTSPGRT